MVEGKIYSRTLEKTITTHLILQLLFWAFFRSHNVDQHYRLIFLLKMIILYILFRLECWADLTCTLLSLATRLKCSLPGEVVATLSKQTAFQSQLQEYLAVFPHLIKYIDIGRYIIQLKATGLYCSTLQDLAWMEHITLRRF